MRCSGAVDRVERDTVATERSQIFGNIRIRPGPVRLHGNDIGAVQQFKDLAPLKNEPLVDLTGDAPVGRDVNKYNQAFAG